MLKTNLPGRARRALGSAIFAVAAVAVGYAAWAAEPATGPTLRAAAADAAPNVTQHLVLHKKGLLKFGPNAQIQTFANAASNGPDGTLILEGDVRIEIVPPAGKTGMAHTVKVIKTPDGEQHIESDQTPPHSLTMTAQKATITTAQDGSVTIEFDDGEVDRH